MLDINEESVTIKRCHTNHCQVCGRMYEEIELVFFIPLDNNLVCRKCATESGCEFEPRIYVKEPD